MSHNDTTKWGNPYEYYPISSVNDIPPPPPPPPPRRRHWPWRWILFVAIVLLSAYVIVMAYLIYSPLLVKMPDQVGRMPTAASNAGYDAINIMSNFISHGTHPGDIAYGSTIQSWSSNMISPSVEATSSVTWADVSTCDGPCAPVIMGLWVYDSNSTAQTAYNDVGQAEMNMQLTPTGGPIPIGAGTPEYWHGRCLLINADNTTVYRSVVTQFCL